MTDHSARLAYARQVLAETAEISGDDVQWIADRARLRAALEVMVEYAEELSDASRIRLAGQ